MSANDYLIEATTRHQIFVQRFGGGEVRKILPFLRAMALELNKKLSSENMTEFSRKRAMIFSQELGQIIAEAIGGIQKQIVLDMTDFALYEAEFIQKVLQGAVTVKTVGATPEVLRAAISKVPMNLISGKKLEKLTMQQAFKGFANSASNATAIRKRIQAGAAQGMTNQQITRDILRFSGGRTKANAESLVRTVTNHIAGVASDAVAKANEDILEGEVVIATLDDATTLTCAGYDQEVFPIGVGPVFPIHWRCRTKRVMKISKKYQALEIEGQRPSKGDDGKKVVGGKKSYGGFLKDQSAEFQDRAIGPERAKLFRGGMKIDKFTDDNGILLTLKELKENEGITL
jgi:hypothetical protein